MKRRHLLAGLTIVLAISLAVPALGAGGLAGLKSLVKKALSTATSAQSTATNAQQAAGNAGDAAKAAQTTASSALATANGAQAKATGVEASAANALGAASAAQGAANAAQGTANAAQGAANTAKNAADTAKTAADGAAATAAAKFGQIVKTEPAGSVTKGNNIKEAIVSCPDNTIVVSRGYHFTSGTAEVHVDEPSNNGWRVQAQSGGDPYDFVVVASCLKP